MAIAAITAVSIVSIAAFNIYMRHISIYDGTAAVGYTQNEVEETKDGFVQEDDGYKYYVDGEMKTNAWQQDDDGNYYYLGVNGKACTGRCIVDDVTYFFNDDGSIYTGWKIINNIWYYFTENGAYTNGYFTITDEYGNDDEFYFDENSHLVTSKETPDGRMADEDGYLTDNNTEENGEDTDATNAAAELEGFTYTGSTDIAPGELSGITIAGEPAEFYMLSVAGETSGGQIIVGDRGRAYGLCQYDYRYDLVDFMKWAYSKHPELWSGFQNYISLTTGDEALVGNTGIVQAFQSARTANYEAAITDELSYMRSRYWDSFKVRLDNAGFNLSQRHIAVSAAMFSVNVNCGAQPDAFISNLSPDMTDIELICGVYKIRNSLLANQTVGRYGKKGTTGRYLAAEPQMALDLYHGYTTIDSHKNYGSGVQWCGDIFVPGNTRTVELLGASSEWKETMNETEAVESSAVESESAEETDDVSEDVPTEPGESLAEKQNGENEDETDSVEDHLSNSGDESTTEPNQETTDSGNVAETTAEYFSVLD